MSPAKRNSSSTSVCTLDLACNLLRLKSFPSKRYLIGIPLSPSWKAAVSMAENFMLNRVGASTQPCLTLLSQEMDQKIHHRFGPVQAYHRGTASPLLGIGRTAKLRHTFPKTLTTDCIKCFGKVNKGHVEVHAVPGISLEAALLWRSCQLFLCPFWIHTGFLVEALPVQGVHSVGYVELVQGTSQQLTIKRCHDDYHTTEDSLSLWIGG